MPTGIYKRTDENLQNLRSIMVTPEYREKMSQSTKGIHKSLEYRKKLSVLARKRFIENPEMRPIGNKHWNWQGGKKTLEELAGRKKPEFCELCGNKGKICFDHDHKTNQFRGWICFQCNAALGLARDNVTILSAMIKYLEKNK